MIESKTSGLAMARALNYQLAWRRAVHSRPLSVTDFVPDGCARRGPDITGPEIQGTIEPPADSH